MDHTPLRITLGCIPHRVTIDHIRHSITVDHIPHRINVDHILHWTALNTIHSRSMHWRSFCMCVCVCVFSSTYQCLSFMESSCSWVFHLWKAFRQVFNLSNFTSGSEQQCTMLPLFAIRWSLQKNLVPFPSAELRRFTNPVLIIIINRVWFPQPL